MAIDNFIPEIWAAELETEFHAAAIVIPTVNGKYVGEIASGNKVKITGAFTPNIQDYKAAGRVLTTQVLDDSGQDLLIDQEKAVSFYVDDIDAVQAAGSFEDYTVASGQALMEDAESFLLGKMLTESHGLNITGASPVTIDDAAKARKALLDIRKYLNEQKIPTGNRYAVINPAFASFLIDQLSDASYAGGDGELRNGVVGRIYGMTVLESPLLGDLAKPTAVGYHTAGVAFAGQIDTIRANPAHDRFATQVDLLRVYGGKVIRQNLVASYVSGGVAQNAASTFLS